MSFLPFHWTISDKSFDENRIASDLIWKNCRHEDTSQSEMFKMKVKQHHQSMDWLKGKSTGNHRFSHEIWGVSCNFHINQSIESKTIESKTILQVINFKSYEIKVFYLSITGGYGVHT